MKGVGWGFHAVPFQPGPVLVEVGARRRDEERVHPETAQTEGDVGGHPAPADVQLTDEEGDRDLLQPLGDEIVGEAPVEGHQVVGCHGTGHGDTHGESPYRRSGAVPAWPP